MNTPAPKTALIGAGAIGTLFAAIMAKSGDCPPVLIDRNAQRAAERTQHGIFIKTPTSCWLAKLPVHCRPQDCGMADLVFICVKSYDTESAAALLPQISTDKTLVVSLQNGIGNAETIARYAPGRTICAVTSMGADIENSCTTRWTGRGPTILAPFENTPMHCATTVAENLQHCGIDASATTDADELLWSKLIINCAINPVTAAYRITNGELLNHNEAYRTACAIARECAQVARAANIKLSYSDPIEAFTSVCRKTSGNRSSMLRDILNGNRTEIDSINGSVIKRAEQLGLPTPENRRIFDLITHPQRLET